MPQKLAQQVDFEQLGYRTMMEVRDENRAKAICGLHLHALSDELQPEMRSCLNDAGEKRHRIAALAAQLYSRPVPASDAAMIALGIGCVILVLLFVPAAIASAVSHAATFMLFGVSWPTALGIGITLTGVVLAAGQQFFERVLRIHPLLEGLLVLVSFALCIWGIVHLAEARSMMTGGVLASPTKTESFVEEPNFTESAEEPSVKRQENEQTQEGVSALLRDALIKIMLAMDLAVGMLLALIVSICTGADFAAWRHVARLKRNVVALDRRHHTLETVFEMAKKKAMAGILRGKHFQGATHIPYFLPVVVFAMLGAASVAQAHMPRMTR